LEITTTCSNSQNRKYIDFENLFIRQIIKKIVDDGVFEIDIYKVVNPNMEPLLFEVSLETNIETVNVGYFSLYPPDNGGVFKFRFNEKVLKKAKYSAHKFLIVKHVSENNMTISNKVKVWFEFSGI
ncbi:MAG: hypothetical protein WAT37_21430, partial [Saprospiraceae bacterium]